MLKGVIFLLIGPSGSGKTSINTKILEKFPDMRRFITFTTRSPRPGEKNGVDYFFISDDEFSKMIQAGELIEWQEFYGQKYGSTPDGIYAFVEGGIDGIAAYDVLGASQLNEKFPENIITIFIIPPSIESVQKRLLDRYGSKSEGKLRIERFNMEMGYAGNFKYVVNNDDLASAIQDVESIIRAEKCYRRARTYKNSSQTGATQ